MGQVLTMTFPKQTRCLLCFVQCLSLLLAGYSSDVSLAVELATDFVFGVDFQIVQTEIEGSEPQQTPAVASDKDFGTSRRLVSLENLEQDAARKVRVTLLNANREPIATRLCIVENTENQVITLVIGQQCRNVDCANTRETCVAGECQDATCMSGTEDTCNISAG